MTNAGQPTQKTSQVMLVAQTKPWPTSQKIERMAIYNSDGSPFNGDEVGTPVKPVVATALAAVTNAVAVDASVGDVYDLLLTSSSWTVSAPTNAHDGKEMTIRLTQDGTGSRTLAWNAIFDFGSSPGAVTLSTGANKVDILKFHYVAALTKWCCILVAKGD